jgi:hypothetical protein
LVFVERDALDYCITTFDLDEGNKTAVKTAHTNQITDFAKFTEVYKT